MVSSCETCYTLFCAISCHGGFTQLRFVGLDAVTDYTYFVVGNAMSRSLCDQVNVPICISIIVEL